MDQEWKKQNQGSSEPDNPAQASPNPAGQTIKPQSVDSLSPPPPNPAPRQPIPNQAFSAPNAYDQYDPNTSPVSPRKKVIVMITVMTLLVIPGAGGAYFLFGKDKPETQQASEVSTPQEQIEEPEIEQKSIEIPADWLPVDTKLAFALKAPAGSSVSEVIESDSEGFISKDMSITDSNGNRIGVGTQSLSASTSQADFDKAIKDLLEMDASLSGLGGEATQNKVSTSKISINGAQWIKIDRETPEEFSSILYIWANDHAVFLTASSNKKETLDKLVNDYLFPMAASVELK